MTIPIDDLTRAALNCSLPEAVETIGERWSFLILRAAFNGIGNFDRFQAELGIARNILANRLARLTGHGILERHPDPEDRRRVDYRLTAKGEALLPVLIALRQWGERWGSGGPANPVLVVERDRLAVREISVHAADGRVLSLDELRWAARETLGDSADGCDERQRARG